MKLWDQTSGDGSACLWLQFSSGEIGPFDSVKLEIIWQPTIPGKVESDLVFTFSDPPSENVSYYSFSQDIKGFSQI